MARTTRQQVEGPPTWILLFKHASDEDRGAALAVVQGWKAEPGESPRHVVELQLAVRRVLDRAGRMRRGKLYWAARPAVNSDGARRVRNEAQMHSLRLDLVRVLRQFSVRWRPPEFRAAHKFARSMDRRPPGPPILVDTETGASVTIPAGRGPDLEYRYAFGQLTRRHELPEEHARTLLRAVGYTEIRIA